MSTQCCYSFCWFHQDYIHSYFSKHLNIILFKFGVGSPGHNLAISTKFPVYVFKKKPPKLRKTLRIAPEHSRRFIDLLASVMMRVIRIRVGGTAESPKLLYQITSSFLSIWCQIDLLPMQECVHKSTSGIKCHYTVHPLQMSSSEPLRLTCPTYYKYQTCAKFDFFGIKNTILFNNDVILLYHWFCTCRLSLQSQSFNFDFCKFEKAI